MAPGPILRLIPRDDLGMLIAAFVDDCRLADLSPRTVERYQDQLMRYHWWCERNDVALDPTQHTKDDLRRFFVYLQTAPSRWDLPDHPPSNRPTKASTRGAYHRTLQRFFNWLVEDEEELDVSPMVKVRRPNVVDEQPDPFSDKELARLVGSLRAAGNGYLATRNRAIVAVLLDVGLRASELGALTFEHYNMSTGDLLVAVGKGGKSRQLRLGARARQQVRRYWIRHRQLLGDDNGPIFVSERGARLTRSGLRKMTTELGRLSTVEPCNPHRFRHTMAVSAIRAGMSEFHLQAILGHTSLEMVRRYVKLAEADVARASQEHSPLDHLKLGL